MKKFFAIFLLLCGTAQAEPFADGQSEAGKKLFDKYQCNRCHNGKMGGDGNAIFTRSDRKVKDPQQLEAQILVCARNVRANFSTQEKLDLAAYLNKNFYKFK
jgi:cytochrome c peroxidase